MKVYGSFNINALLKFAIPSMIFACMFCYYMAVKYHEAKPFPHATLTSTASHYPQDIVFRYIMLMCSSILTLTFFSVFKWLATEANRIGFKQLPRYYFIVMNFSIFCYAVAVGTIDQLGRGKWHGPCAVLFFVIWVIGIINLTVYITKLSNWDTSVISRTSLLIKQTLALYLLIVWIYCIYGLTTQQSNLNKQDKYVVIVQWNSVFINLLWTLSFIFQWKHFKIGLVSTL